MKVESQINIDDLTNLLISAARLLAAFATLKPFESTNIGLAEWVTREILEKKGGVSSKRLSRILGVARLRANQLLAILSKEELATIREATYSSSVARLHCWRPRMRTVSPLTGELARIDCDSYSSFRSGVAVTPVVVGGREHQPVTAFGNPIWFPSLEELW